MSSTCWAILSSRRSTTSWPGISWKTASRPASPAASRCRSQATIRRRRPRSRVSSMRSASTRSTPERSPNRGVNSQARRYISKTTTPRACAEPSARRGWSGPRTGARRRTARGPTPRPPRPPLLRRPSRLVREARSGQDGRELAARTTKGGNHASANHARRLLRATGMADRPGEPRRSLSAARPAKELWRIPEPWLAEAQDDATVLAIKAQQEAGLDIITDGEIRRESYSNRFATALEGIDIDNPGVALDRSGHPNPVPRIAGKIRRKHAVEVDDLKFLRARTSRMVKMTVPGPFTMSQQAQNDFYRTVAEAAMDYAEAVNAEIKDLFAAGADIVQIDEPYMQART